MFDCVRTPPEVVDREGAVFIELVDSPFSGRRESNTWSSDQFGWAEVGVVGNTDNAVLLKTGSLIESAVWENRIAVESKAKILPLRRVTYFRLSVR